MNWDKPYLNNVTYAPFNQVEFDRLELSGQSALDIGCGTGALANQLSKVCDKVTGIDLSPVAIAKAKTDYPTIDFKVADYLDIHGKYDLITAKLLVAFVDLEQFFTKVESLLNSGGVVLIQTPVTYPGYEYDDKYKSISVYNPDLMTRILMSPLLINYTGGQPYNLSYQGEVGCLKTICLRKERVYPHILTACE